MLTLDSISRTGGILLLLSALIAYRFEDSAILMALGVSLVCMVATYAVSNRGMFRDTVALRRQDSFRALIAAGAVVLFSVALHLRVPPALCVWIAAALVAGLLPLSQIQSPDRHVPLLLLGFASQLACLALPMNLPLVPAVLLACAASLYLVVHQRLWPPALAYVATLASAQLGPEGPLVMAPILTAWLMVLHRSVRRRTYRLYTRLAAGSPTLTRCFAALVALQNTVNLTGRSLATLHLHYRKNLGALASFHQIQQLEQGRFVLRQSDLDGIRLVGNPTQCNAILFWHTADFLTRIIALLHLAEGDTRPVILPRQLTDDRFEAALTRVVRQYGRDILLPHTSAEHLAAQRKFRNRGAVWIIGAEFALTTASTARPLQRILARSDKVLVLWPGAVGDLTDGIVTDFARLDIAAYVQAACAASDDIVIDLRSVTDIPYTSRPTASV